jgi:hypothetical protein
MNGARSYDVRMRVYPLLLIAALASPSVAAKTPKAPKARTPCECSASRMCWSLVIEGFDLRFKQALREVEAAQPGRFFPKSQPFALEKPDAQGNFLTMAGGCGPSGCEEQRDELQKRVVFSSLLSVLPPARPAGALYHPGTWELTAKGDAVVAELRRCRPGVLGELTEVVMGRKPRLKYAED